MALPPDFAIIWTDGDQTHVPTKTETDSGYKSSDAYGLSQKALMNFATEMNKKLGRKADRCKSEQHRSFTTAPPISKNSCYTFLYFLHDRSPRIEFPVSCMCDHGPFLLVVLAQAAASRLGRSVFKSKPPITATWKPLCAPYPRMLEALSKFVESKLVTKMSIVGWKLFVRLKGNHSEFKSSKPLAVLRVAWNSVLFVAKSACNNKTFSLFLCTLIKHKKHFKLILFDISYYLHKDT